jgi:hypothetical protein
MELFLYVSDRLYHQTYRLNQKYHPIGVKSWKKLQYWKDKDMMTSPQEFGIA